MEDNKNILCIVNSMAVQKYKLKMVKTNIQDFSENKTRFLVIGKHKINKTGKDKTSFLIKNYQIENSISIDLYTNYQIRKNNLNFCSQKNQRFFGGCFDK